MNTDGNRILEMTEPKSKKHAIEMSSKWLRDQADQLIRLSIQMENQQGNKFTEGSYHEACQYTAKSYRNAAITLMKSAQVLEDDLEKMEN